MRLHIESVEEVEGEGSWVKLQFGLRDPHLGDFSQMELGLDAVERTVEWNGLDAPQLEVRGDSTLYMIKTIYVITSTCGLRPRGIVAPAGHVIPKASTRRQDFVHFVGALIGSEHARSFFGTPEERGQLAGLYIPVAPEQVEYLTAQRQMGIRNPRDLVALRPEE